MAVTRETELTFGKHKGEKIRDVPTGYLKWAIDGGLTSEGLVKKYGAAFERELEIRRADQEKRPLDPEPQKPEASRPASFTGKTAVDNILVAFDYIKMGLSRLGYPTDQNGYVEAIQKLATTAAIYANDRELNLRQELGQALSKMHSEEAEQEPLPF